MKGKATNIRVEFEMNGKPFYIELAEASVDFANHLHKIGEGKNFEEFKSGVKGLAFNKWVLDEKSTNKPLKDQSYHQKRIADALEKISLAEYWLPDDSEDHIRKIVREEIKKYEKYEDPDYWNKE